MIYKPNFSNAMKKANEILLSSTSITDFPFSAIKLVEEFSDIRCHTFRYAREHNIPIDSFGSPSAVLIELNGRFILFFDDSKNIYHCRYSILHEFAHLYLEHPIRTSTHSMSVEEKEKYRSYEIEANYFVAQLVMPLQLLIALEKKGYDINPNFLQRNFGVSNEAATKRVRCFNKNKHIKFSLAERKYDIAILKNTSIF